jgi:hypothetical protein
MAAAVREAGNAEVASRDELGGGSGLDIDAVGGPAGCDADAGVPRGG